MTQQPTDKQQKTLKTLFKNISLDKAQAFVTLITALLSIYITFQAHQIKKEIDLAKNNIDKATFVKELLENLTSSQDKKIRSDIALIIINRLIPQNPQEKLMVAEIAEQIYRDNLHQAQKLAKEFDNKSKNKGNKCDFLQLSQFSGFSTSAVAFNILEENNPQKAQSLMQEFLNKNRLIKKKNNKTASRIEPQSTCVEQLERYYSVLNKVVYLQFNNEEHRNEITEFGNQLKEIRWNVPVDETNTFGQCHLTGYTWKNDRKPISTIRYYHVSDLSRAKRLQKLAQRYFKKNFSLDDLSVVFPNQPFGQIEIWIYYDDKEFCQ